MGHLNGRWFGAFVRCQFKRTQCVRRIKVKLKWSRSTRIHFLSSPCIMWKYFASHDWGYLYYLSFNVIFVSLANNHVDSNVEKQEDSVYKLASLNKHGHHDGVYTHWSPGSDFEAVQGKLTNCMGFSVHHCLLFCLSTFPFNVNHVSARKRNPLVISSWNNLQFHLLASCVEEIFPPFCVVSYTAVLMWEFFFLQNSQ